MAWASAEAPRRTLLSTTQEHFSSQRMPRPMRRAQTLDPRGSRTTLRGLFILLVLLALFLHLRLDLDRFRRRLGGSSLGACRGIGRAFLSRTLALLDACGLARQIAQVVQPRLMH